MADLEKQIVEAVGAASADCGVPADGTIFVFEAIAESLKDKEIIQSLRSLLGKQEPTSNIVTALDICETVVGKAAHEFGGMALSVLQNLGISDTMTVGKVVFALAKTGLIRSNDNDTLEDFNIQDFDFAKILDPDVILKDILEERFIPEEDFD